MSIEYFGNSGYLPKQPVEGHLTKTELVSGIDLALNSEAENSLAGDKAKNVVNIAAQPVAIDENKLEETAQGTVNALDETADEEVSEEELQSITETLASLNQEVPISTTSLVFEFDELNKPPLIKLVNRDNGETIREIPPKYLQDVTTALEKVADNLSKSGILVDTKI